jgi:cell shape-determining protein MreD
MYIRIGLNAILIFIFAILQFGLISALPGIFGQIDLFISALIFVLALFGYRTAFWWAFFLGIICDSMSFLPFGVYLAAFIVLLAGINFLLKNFFTNRSLYSFLALAVFSVFIFKLIVYSSSEMFYFWGLSGAKLDFSKAFWLNEFYYLMVNLIFIAFVFYAINFVSRRLKPAFLIRK